MYPIKAHSCTQLKRVFLRQREALGNFDTVRNNGALYVAVLSTCSFYEKAYIIKALYYVIRALYY